MRKRYIFWWVISAIFFWFFVAGLLYGEGIGGTNGIALFIFGVTFYVGYLRHKEYEQQQEDRNALHRFVEYNVDSDKERQSNCVDHYCQRKSSNIQFDKKFVTVQVVGETFINEDGTLRQQILKDAFDMGCLGIAGLEAYNYQGYPAIHVLYNGEVVGNIKKAEVDAVSVLLDWIVSVDLSVNRFIPHDNQDRSADSRRAYVDQYIYFAEIKIHYLCPK